MEGPRPGTEHHLTDVPPVPAGAARRTATPHPRAPGSAAHAAKLCPPARRPRWLHDLRSADGGSAGAAHGVACTPLGDVSTSVHSLALSHLP